MSTCLLLRLQSRVSSRLKRVRRLLLLHAQQLLLWPKRMVLRLRLQLRLEVWLGLWLRIVLQRELRLRRELLLRGELLGKLL